MCAMKNVSESATKEKLQVRRQYIAFEATLFARYKVNRPLSWQSSDTNDPHTMHSLWRGEPPDLCLVSFHFH